MNPLQNLVRNYLRAKERYEKEKTGFDKAQQSLINYLAESHLKTAQQQIDNEIHTATYVQAVRYDIDVDGLREALGEKEFKKYCCSVFSKESLEEAMAQGSIDPEFVGKFVTERKNKPSVRVSTRAAEQAG